MELLKEITDGEIPKKVKKNFAVRGIFFDDDNKIPILLVSKNDYHKLPGGGVEKGEDKSTALKRKFLEETGCDIEVQGILGKVREYRKEKEYYKANYCYYGSILEKGEPNFTEEEKERGFKVIWLSLEEAIALLEKDKPKSYAGKFIQERDLVFLNKAADIILKQSQRKRTM